MGSARIVERGRGPEIEGTRITVYRIMDFVVEDAPPSEIAAELRLTEEQVRVALEYMQQHRAEVEAVYEQLLARDRAGNPPWVDVGRAKTVEELKERIPASEAATRAHADPAR